MEGCSGGEVQGWADHRCTHLPCVQVARRHRILVYVDCACVCVCVCVCACACVYAHLTSDSTNKTQYEEGTTTLHLQSGGGWGTGACTLDCSVLVLYKRCTQASTHLQATHGRGTGDD